MTVDHMIIDLTATRRLDSMHVAQADGCWQWTGAFKSNHRGAGYGQFWLLCDEDPCPKPSSAKLGRCIGHTKSAHRTAYRMYKGEITIGMEIDHTCNNPSCVNPEHLEQVTPGENKNRQSERRELLAQEEILAEQAA